MENKYFFNVETAWPFPIIQYVASTSYVEVRKASGIAYILLELISNAVDSDEKLVTTLKNLGVPYDIHYIFGGELANMINYGIIQIKAGRDFGIDLLDMYRLSNFEITDLGKKLFAEGTIPTGNNSAKKLSVYYDLATKNTIIRSDWRLFRIENAVIDKSCIGNVQLNSDDVEMYISENMPKYGFKKGERISGYEHDEPEVLVYKLEDAVTIRIDQGKMYLSAKDKDRDAYIKNNYSMDIVSKVIGAKKKYYFPEGFLSEVQAYDYSQVADVEKIMMPFQLFDALGVKNQLSLSKLTEMKRSECIISRGEAAELLQKCGIVGLACYFDNGILYNVLPGRFAFEVEGLQGKCEVNLVIVQRLSDEVGKMVMREIFLQCIQDNEPYKKCDIIKKLAEISGCKDYVEQYTYTLLKQQNNIEDKINIFLILNEQFVKITSWSKVAKEEAQRMFDELCNRVTVDNFGAVNSIGEKLNKILRLNELDYLSSISKKLIEDEGDEIAYEAMDGLKYGVETILGVVNMFKSYCIDILEGKTISSQSKLGIQCALLGQSLSELKELTGISNVTEDAAELDIDADRFIRIMATYSDTLKKLEKYKMYADEQYKVFLSFQDRYAEIKEVIFIEKEASRNPGKINANYINQMLKKSRYKDAICDLHVRLQYELNRIFGKKNAQTFDLLSDVSIIQYLSEDELSKMHALRMCRNEFQHPTGKRNDKYSEQTIREWCEIVEKLGGTDNEPRSKN